MVILMFENRFGNREECIFYHGVIEEFTDVLISGIRRKIFVVFFFLFAVACFSQRSVENLLYFFSLASLALCFLITVCIPSVERNRSHKISRPKSLGNWAFIFGTEIIT